MLNTSSDAPNCNHMAQKTYALVDLIGIKTAFSAGRAAEILEQFWNAADAWTNSQNFSPVFIPAKKYLAAPEVHVCTFSDSALLYTREELEIDDFLDIVRSFKRHIESRGCPSYAIVLETMNSLSLVCLPSVLTRLALT
jgi:hypothetical protein